MRLRPTRAQLILIFCFALLGLALVPLQALAGLPITSAHQATNAPSATGDWPMYGHDVSRTNFNPDEHTINSGNLNQLVQRWQVNIGSNGTPPSAAPSVSNGVVYAASSAPSGNNFFAFDAVTGAQIWAKSIGYRSSCFDVGIGSTPAISGTTAVIGADNAQANPSYYGFSTIDGAQLWQNPMNVGPSGFPWAAPLIAHNSTYIGIASRCDNPSVRGEIRRLDLATGTQLANQYFVDPGQAGGGIWNSPALSPDGSIIAVGTGEDYLGCTPCSLTRSMVTLDALTLVILQHHQEPSPGNDLDFGTTPVIFHDSQNRLLVAANHKNGTFYAYLLNNVNNGSLWTRATGTDVGMMPAYDPTFGSGGTLFIIGTSHLYAVDPATGTDRWGPIPLNGLYPYGNMAIANGLIFLNTGSTGLQIRDETNGQVIRTLMPANAGSAYSGVAVSNGFIYWLSGSYINAWSLPQGQATPTPTATSVPTDTPTVIPSATSTPQPTNTLAPTQTPGGPTATTQPTATPTGVPSATPTVCSITFLDVPPGSTFYPYVECLACRGVVSGYDDGTFRPNNDVTRGQISKIVSSTAGFNDDPGSQMYQDVPPTDTFYRWINRLSHRGIMGGYQCGGPGEPCIPPANLPYFRSYNPATRGQIAKIDVGTAQLVLGWTLLNPTSGTFQDVSVDSDFFRYIETAFTHKVLGGYPCGSPPAGECIPPDNKPYFLPNNNTTRGQTSKIVSNTFFPECNPPARR